MVLSLNCHALDFCSFSLAHPSRLFALSQSSAASKLRKIFFTPLQVVMSLLVNLWWSCVKEPTIIFWFSYRDFCISFSSCLGWVSARTRQENSWVMLPSAICKVFLHTNSHPASEDDVPLPQGEFPAFLGISSSLLWSGLFQYLSVPKCTLPIRPWGSSDKKGPWCLPKLRSTMQH